MSSMASCVSTKPARAARSHVCTYAPRNENQVRHGLVGLVCFFIRLNSAIRISHLSSLSVPLGHDMPKGRRGNPLSKVCIIRRPRRRRQDMQCVCVCVCVCITSWSVLDRFQTVLQTWNTLLPEFPPLRVQAEPTAALPVPRCRCKGFSSGNVFASSIARPSSNLLESCP